MASQFWKARAGAEEVSRLRHALVDYAIAQGIGQRLVDDLALAVTEVVTNAVVHGYPDRPDGEITVMATKNGEELTIRVLDEGVGLTPRIDSPGAGFGLAIAGKVAQRMVVEHPQRGGTEVRLTFAAAA